MKVIFFTLFLFLFVLASGQISEPKFGKIETTQLSLSKYDKDATADALMLFNSGTSLTFYPTITKFNSVLTRVEIDGKTVLLDGVSKYCPFGVLPSNDINGKGRVVNELEGDWVTLDASDKYKEIKNYQLQINADGNLTGQIISSYDGYQESITEAL
jgi:hypothetical protein